MLMLRQATFPELQREISVILTIYLQVFKPEQLEDLEGVLWKSYFA